jgi:hypothetical protein
MQFKQPEVLYALLLLLIPLFIHLFQLRKYQRVWFTNVAFLKKVNIQTRKSSRLKKWLTLLLRMLAVACLVMAFAQPYSASLDATRTDKEIVVYLDNSYSMQLAGNNGPMLKRAEQDLFDLPLPEGRISWFTNDQTFRNSSATDFRQQVLQVGYTHKQLDLNTRLLAAQSLFSDNPTSLKRFFLISDLQGVDQTLTSLPGVELGVVQTTPVATNNVSIDSLTLIERQTGSARVKVWLSKTGTGKVTSPVSLYRDGTLLSKIGVTFEEPGNELIYFDIDQPDNFIGKIEVEDSNILYDNILYFNIPKLNKVRVLSINQGDSAFLDRMFEQQEFDYQKMPYNAINYSVLTNQNLVVLNQLETLPASLTTTLLSFVNNGGSVAIVPSLKADLSTYNTLLNGLGLGTLSPPERQSKKITRIRFEHPLYEDVFEKKVINFQYPSIEAYFPLQTTASTALAMDDDSPFLVSAGPNYFFTAPLDTQSTNFTSSPLIVPTLFNIALKSLPPALPYFEIDRENSYTVDYKLMRDEILQLSMEGEQFIPSQQNRPNGTLITTVGLPDKAGNYRIMHKDSTIAWTSYNYPRSESRLRYLELSETGELRIFDDVNTLTDYISDANSVKSFWKWFVILALLFLIGELLVLKFLNV